MLCMAQTNPICGLQVLPFLNIYFRGAWVAQSIKHLTSARVRILWSMGSSPTSGSVLIALSLEPASESMSLSLSAPPLLVLGLSQK